MYTLSKFFNHFFDLYNKLGHIESYTKLEKLTFEIYNHHELLLVRNELLNLVRRIEYAIEEK